MAGTLPSSGLTPGPNPRLGIMVYDMGKVGLLYERFIYGTDFPAVDFPGGAGRLIQKAMGLRYKIVNGAVTFEGNDCTWALPGKLHRSYNNVS